MGRISADARREDGPPALPGSILLFEPVCIGSEHVPVNSAMLSMARTAFPGHRIVFAAEAAHLGQVAEMSTVPRDSVDWRVVEVPPRHGPRDRARRRREWRLWSDMLRIIDEHDVENLVLLSVSFDGLLDLKAWLWRRPRLRVIGILHSVLAVVMASRRSRWQWWFGPAPHLRWLVLGKHIAEALEAEFRPIMPRVRWIPHPVLGLEPEARGDAETGDNGPAPTVFAFPGVATDEKGFGEFCAIAEALKEDRRARFEVVGRVPPEAAFDRHGPVSAPEPSAQGLGRREYEQRIRRSRYLLLPLRPEAYRFVASGSLMDALVLGRPIIGSAKSPPTRALFDQFGDLGHLCDNVESMVELVGRLIDQPDPDRYGGQLENLRKAKAALAPEALAAPLADSFA
jgi:glycosyltransferase involved in cell wall biosynthesis